MLNFTWEFLKIRLATLPLPKNRPIVYLSLSRSWTATSKLLTAMILVPKITLLTQSWNLLKTKSKTRGRPMSLRLVTKTMEKKEVPLLWRPMPPSSSLLFTLWPTELDVFKGWSWAKNHRRWCCPQKTHWRVSSLWHRKALTDLIWTREISYMPFKAANEKRKNSSWRSRNTKRKSQSNLMQEW